MKYYGYVRVSTETQAKSGYGLETQEQKIREYASANEIELAEIFRDAGKTGTTIDRDGLLEMLAAVSKGDRVIVLNTNRLWRSDEANIIIKRELKKAKSEIISIEQPNYSLYEKDPNGFFVNGIMELLDQYDRMLISRKLAAGRRTKAKNGDKPAGVTPLGYTWRNQKVVIEPRHSKTVALIFQAQAITKNYQKTADYLNRKGLRTRNGKRFTRQGVCAIINNDFYIGVVTHAGQKIAGNHPVFITEELWTKAHAA